MGAATSDRNTPRKDGQLIAVPVAAGANVLAGTIAAANATGYVEGGSTAATLTYLGMFDESADNTDGADGDRVVLVRRGVAFHFANDGTDPVTQASLGLPCYIVDNQTVAATDDTGARSAAGIVIGLDDAGVWVQ